MHDKVTNQYDTEVDTRIRHYTVRIRRESINIYMTTQLWVSYPYKIYTLVQPKRHHLDAQINILKSGNIIMHFWIDSFLEHNQCFLCKCDAQNLQ